MTEHTHIDPEEILVTIRQSELTRLVDHSQKSDIKRRELYDLLTREPVEINRDQFLKITASGKNDVAFIRTFTPNFRTSLEKPSWEDKSFHGLKIHLKRALKYHAGKILIKLLPQCLTFEERIKPCAIVRRSVLLNEECRGQVN